MMGKNIFERLNAGRPPVQKTNSKQSQKIQHAQKVLMWVQRWTEPTIGIRDFRVYGPRPRDHESALSAARTLTRNGWLEPMQVRRYDSHMWRIIRKPIIDPKL